MTDFLIEICVGSIAFLAVVLIVFMVRNKPFKVKKIVGEKESTITVIANKSINKVLVITPEITFERSKLKKGQIIDFTFPNSDKKVKLIVETEQDKKKEYDV